MQTFRKNVILSVDIAAFNKIYHLSLERTVQHSTISIRMYREHSDPLFYQMGILKIYEIYRVRK